MATLSKTRTLPMIISGLIIGVSITCWIALGHFDQAWVLSTPHAPTGGFIYAHVEHGGLSYFNAEQSTASHLWLPIGICAAVGLLSGLAARGEGGLKKRLPDRADMVQAAFILLATGATILVLIIYGHAILDALASTPFGPSNDSLDMQDRN
jgi:hypothetical protein